MVIADAAALVLMILGALLFLVASIGLVRFPEVLSRTHAASKPQTLGLILMVAGMALVLRTVEGLCLAVLVLLAQMATVPVSSTLLARAAFRRGFVRGGAYAIDELSPRLARTLDEDDDEDGFIDEDELGPEVGDFADADERFPTNVVGGGSSGSDLSRLSNWDEAESEPLVEPEEIDIDESDLLEPEDVERG